MTKKRVLIVEDEPVIAMDEEQIMRALGYEVTGIAMTGKDAVEQAGRDRPDAVLMDIKLVGDMDGREATSKIRELHQIPVVIVTALGSREMSKCQNTPPPEGIGFIHKPFTEAELVSEIK